MIKSIKISNFQSHESSSLDFHPGVNIIVGSSDGGKTAIIRALRWIIANRPSGDAIRSWWGGETQVRLETEKGIVVRTKDKDDSYLLNDGTEYEFKAFRTSVPEEISRFLNVNEINLQQQLDSPFLLSETPGAVAEHFNKVAKLDKIDLGTQNIASSINTLSATIGKPPAKDKPASGMIKQILDAEEELKRYDHLELFESEVLVLEATVATVESQKLEAFNLGKLINEVKSINIRIETESKKTRVEEDIKSLLSLYKEKSAILLEHEVIVALIAKINTLERSIAERKKISVADKEVSLLLELHKVRKTLSDQLSGASRALSFVKSNGITLADANAKYDALKKELDKIDICPFCGSKMKK